MVDKTALDSGKHPRYASHMSPLIEDKFLDVPPQMALAIASGIEDPARVAERHGFDEDQWEALKVFEPFVKLIEAKKAELRTAGVTFRLKCGMISEMMLDDLYTTAIAEGTSFSSKLEFTKFTSKAAGLDAPPKEEANTGSQFSITINLGQGKSIHVGATTKHTPDIIDVEPEDAAYDFDMAAIPAHLRGAGWRSGLMVEVE